MVHVLSVRYRQGDEVSTKIRHSIISNHHFPPNLPLTNHLVLICSL